MGFSDSRRRHPGRRPGRSGRAPLRFASAALLALAGGLAPPLTAAPAAAEARTAPTAAAVSPIPVGGNPVDVAVAPNGRRAYVTNLGANTVAVIDTRTNQVVGRPIPVGSSPSAVAVTPNGRRAYITNVGSDTVSVIDI